MYRRGDDSVLWTLHKAGVWLDCLVALVPTGIDVRLERNGRECEGRIFATPEQAYAWADEEKARRLAEGWTLHPAAPPARRSRH